MRLQPPRGEVDVGHRGGVRRLAAETEVHRRHDKPVRRELLDHRRVLGPIVVVPGATVDLDDRMERTLALRLVHAGEQAWQVLDILPRDVECRPYLNRLCHPAITSRDSRRAGTTSLANSSTERSVCSDVKLPNEKQPMT